MATRPTSPTRRARFGVLLGAAVLIAAACGDDSGDAAATTQPPAATDPTGSPTTQPSGDDDYYTPRTPVTSAVPAAGGPSVEVADTDLGEILASDGLTLYVFTPDDAGEPTCYDGCTSTWPPLLADTGAIAGAGLDAALLGTVTRDGGKEQVTYAGWPLYYYVGDSAPGDTTGQGVGGNWFVIAPDGTIVEG